MSDILHTEQCCTVIRNISGKSIDVVLSSKGPCSKCATYIRYVDVDVVNNISNWNNTLIVAYSIEPEREFYFKNEETKERYLKYNLEAMVISASTQNKKNREEKYVITFGEEGKTNKNDVTTETETNKKFTCFIVRNAMTFKKLYAILYLSCENSICKWNVIDYHPLIRNPNSYVTENLGKRDIVLDDSQKDDIETEHENGARTLIESIKANNQVIKSQIENNNAKIQAWFDERCNIA